MKKSLHLLAFVLLVAALLPGCAQPQSAADLQAEKQQVLQVRNATTQAIAGTQQQLATLAPDDPVRATLQTNLDKLSAAITQIDQYLPLLNNAITAAQKSAATGAPPDAASIEPLAAMIPYGSIALAVILGIWNIIQAFQKNKANATASSTMTALTQVVQSVESILPSKTPEQKLALAAGQDQATKALVSAIKGS